VRKENRTEERERRETEAKQIGKNRDTRTTDKADNGGLKKPDSPADQVSCLSFLTSFACILGCIVTVQVKFNSLE
jgi:hypothetical protein